jgi:branched-chain amino acid transport system permease protein
LAMHRRQLVNIIVIVALISLLFLVPLLWKSLYWTHVLILTMINVLLAVSLRAFTRTGQISIGTAGFVLLGAYSSALLTTRLGLSFWITMPLGGLLAAVVALIFGYSFLRAKGIYFAILTVMLAEVCRLTAWYWSSMTGGTAGLKNIPPPDPINILGITTLTFDTKTVYYYLTLVIVIISLIILYRIERSWLGLMWSAINEADNLAQAVGINIMRHKVLIFCITSFFMGIAGALYAHYMGTITAHGTPGSPFGFTASIYVLIYAVVGGETRFAGPIIGAVLLTMFPEAARGLKEYIPLIFGGLLILFMFFLPEGIVSLSAPLSRWYGKAARYLTKKLGRVEDKVT